MSLKLWHNGKIKDQDQALFPFHDRIRLGDGVFDTMLILDGHPKYASLHHSRLLHDASVLGIEGINATDLDQALFELLKENEAITNKGRFALNTLITRGPAGRGLQTPDHQDAQLILRLTPVPDQLPPINAIIARKTHRNEGSPLSQIKSINYGDNILAIREAEARGANDAILLNNARSVTCTTSGNIYAQIDGYLYTPPLSDGVLNGITRQILIKGLDIIEKSLSEPELESAEFLYISNSIRGIVPITKLDGDPIETNPLDEINNTHFS